MAGVPVPSRGPDDLELLVRAQEGDRQALGQLFREYHNFAYSIAWHTTGNENDALDAVQDAFLRLTRKEPKTWCQMGSFRAYLAEVVRNASLDIVCRRIPVESGEEALRRLRQVPASGTEFDPAARIEGLEMKSRVAMALGRLAPELRTAFVLHYLAGLTFQQIAEDVGCSVSTAWSRVKEARGELIKLLGDE